MNRSEVRTAIQDASSKFNAFSKEMGRLSAIEERLISERSQIEADMKMCEDTARSDACKYGSFTHDVLRQTVIDLTQDHNKLSLTLGRALKYDGEGKEKT